MYAADEIRHISDINQTGGPATPYPNNPYRATLKINFVKESSK